MDEPSRDELRAFLEGRDFPCRGCGYNLRGATAPVCPECGKPISLEPPPRLTRSEGTFLAGLAFSLLVAAAWVVAVVCLATDPLDYLAFWVPAGMGIVTLGIGSVWLIALKKPARTRPMLAAANTAVAWSVGILGLLLLLQLVIH